MKITITHDEINEVLPAIASVYSVMKAVVGQMYEYAKNQNADWEDNYEDESYEEIRDSFATALFIIDDRIAPIKTELEIIEDGD